jgi:hypothetical protein
VQNWFNIENTYFFSPQHKTLGKLGPYLNAMSLIYLNNKLDKDNVIVFNLNFDPCPQDGAKNLIINIFQSFYLID